MAMVCQDTLKIKYVRSGSLQKLINRIVNHAATRKQLQTKN